MAKVEAPDKDAVELLQLRADHVDVFAREKELKSILIKKAEAKGENFKETVPALGVVKVSSPKPARCKGTAPEVVVDVFLAAPARTQESLIERGIIKNTEQWTGPYYGAVTVELFPRV